VKKEYNTREQEGRGRKGKEYWRKQKRKRGAHLKKEVTLGWFLALELSPSSFVLGGGKEKEKKKKGGKRGRRRRKKEGKQEKETEREEEKERERGEGEKEEGEQNKEARRPTGKTARRRETHAKST